MNQSAVDFGLEHDSCFEAMDWRRSLPEGTSQSDAWKLCKRGDWMIWQLSSLTDDAIISIGQKIEDIKVHIISDYLSAYCSEPYAKSWVENWINGVDRSISGVRAIREKAIGRDPLVYGCTFLVMRASVSTVELSRFSVALNSFVNFLSQEVPDFNEEHEFLLLANKIGKFIPDWPGK